MFSQGTKVCYGDNKWSLLRDVPGNTDSHVYISATGEGIGFKNDDFYLVGFRKNSVRCFARRLILSLFRKTKVSGKTEVSFPGSVFPRHGG